MSNKNNELKSKDCSDFLFEELKKELIGPSDGLFNRPKYKKKDTEGKGYEIIDTASLSFYPNDPSLHKQEILVDPPKYNYIAGVLYPKKTQYGEIVDENFNDDETQIEDTEITLTLEPLASKLKLPGIN